MKFNDLKLLVSAGTSIKVRAVLMSPPVVGRYRYKVVVSVAKGPFVEFVNARGVVRHFATLDSIEAEMQRLGIGTWEVTDREVK